MDGKAGPPHRPADGPIFLTRVRRHSNVEQFLCTEGPCREKGIILTGVTALNDHTRSQHPGLAGNASFERFKPSETIPKSRANLVARGPQSDLNSVIPNPSEVSQSGRRLLQGIGPNQTTGLTSERSTATALSNLQIEGGLPQIQPTPPSPGTARKRPAGEGPRERRLKRSSGTLPPYSLAAIPRGDPGSPSKHSSLPRASDLPALHVHTDSAPGPAEASRHRHADEQHSEPVGSNPHTLIAKQQSPVIEQERLPASNKGTGSPPPSSPDHANLNPDEDSEAFEEPELLLQPETKPISQGQLIVEVRGIYAGLVLVEAKCIDVDARQIALAQEEDPAKLTAEQWRALIALHKTLLHEHHDFFLASQHPAATPQLSKLAEKYAMPSRMWRHAIHGFLEVLRHRLPDSLEYMLAFIYIAYSMIALLYETVPSFETTWIECLGDLARYRMSIDDDTQDREAWGGVSRFWYSKAVEKIPKTGRLYHHIGILARPFSVQQLSLYARSLTCEIPFISARVSILTLFNPVLERQKQVMSRANPVELLIIRSHAIVFTGHTGQEFLPSVKDLTHGLLDKYASRAQAKFKEGGVAMAQANIGALLGYGLSTPSGVPLGLLYLRLEASKGHHTQMSISAATESQAEGKEKPRTVESLTEEELAVAENLLAHASVLGFGIFSVMLKRYGDRNVLPGIHVYLVFIWYLVRHQSAIDLIQCDIPWTALANFLNSFLRMSSVKPEVMFAESFPIGAEGPQRPLTEDFLLCGQPYADGYLPFGWCENAAVDEEERSLELPSMYTPRSERILWLGQKIAARGIWMTFDQGRGKFSTTDFAKSLQPRQVLWPLSPHPVPAEQGAIEGPNPRDLGSPASDAPSSSTISLNPPSSDLGSSSTPKEKRRSSPFRPIKQEDVDMPDAPLSAKELARGSTEKQEVASEEWMHRDPPSREKAPEKAGFPTDSSGRTPKIVEPDEDRFVE